MRSALPRFWICLIGSSTCFFLGPYSVRADDCNDNGIDDLCESGIGFEFVYSVTGPGQLDIDDAGGAPYSCWMTPVDLDEHGAQGWSLSIAGRGLEVVEATTAGTVGASVRDNPPGLMNGEFELTEITSDGIPSPPRGH